jgi:hydroxyethylthiazole kinase-like uncharacterized protein yjeF
MNEATGKLVLTREDTRRLDQLTISEGSSSLELMERAGERIASFLLTHVDGLMPGGLGRGPTSMLVLAGPGNNGGDGFVVARLLAEQGWDVTVALCSHEPEADSDAGVNLQKWTEQGGAMVSATDALAALLGADADQYDLVLDALFGTGLDRDLGGFFMELVAGLNESGLPIVAVDTPSGLCADSGRPLGIAVLADATVSLGTAKPGLFLGAGPNHAGRIVVADIGLLEPAEAGIEPVGVVLDDEICEAWAPHRHPMTHKGELGHVLVAGGSAGKTGAVLLAARAALRAGAGLVTMAVPASLAAATDSVLAEAMTLALADDGGGHVAAGAGPTSEELTAFDAAVVGPGLGMSTGADELLTALVERFSGPLVVDADGLNLLAAKRGAALRAMLDKRRAAGYEQVILTPHPGEMARLLGIGTADVQNDRLRAVRALATEYGVTAVLKGAATLVCDGDSIGFNSSGNAGMASAGMGDVLAGVAAAFAAQLEDSFEVAALAVYVHGLAGDVLADRRHGPGFLAGELADAIPDALASLRLAVP